MQYEKTINKILQRLTKEIPFAEVGDILETQKTIFPNPSLPREEKDIIINSKEITPPLACSKSWKTLMIKDKADLCQIYKDFDRGDLLKVIDVKPGKVIVENISIDEEFRKQFEVDKIEIAKKNLTLIKRRSIELSRSLKKLGEEN